MTPSAMTQSAVLLAGGKSASVGGWLGELFDFGGATFWVLIAFAIFVALIVWKARGAVTGALDAGPRRSAPKSMKPSACARKRRACWQTISASSATPCRKPKACCARPRKRPRACGSGAEEDLAASLKRREQQALDRIAQAEAAAQAEVRNTAVDLAVSATRKLLEDRIDEKKAAGLVDQAIKELPAKLH